MTFQIINDDCVSALKNIPSDTFHSCITDPPYHLTAGGKVGINNETWDGGNVAFTESLWKEVLRVVKPGGIVAAFSGTRTYHKMTTAIEISGFVVKDMAMWVYASGFPKSMDMGRKSGDRRLDDIKTLALKPANEPICIAQKPIPPGVSTVKHAQENAGLGGLHVKNARIPYTDNSPMSVQLERGKVVVGGKSVKSVNLDAPKFTSSDDRWKPNISVCPGSRNSQSLQSSGMGYKPKNHKIGETVDDFYKNGRYPSNVVFDGSKEAICALGMENSSVFFCAKPTASERNFGGIRNTHPTLKPIALMEHLVKLFTPDGGRVLDPFCGSGTTGVAAVMNGYGFTGIDLTKEFADIAHKRISVITGVSVRTGGKKSRIVQKRYAGSHYLKLKCVCWDMHGA